MKQTIFILTVLFCCNSVFAKDLPFKNYQKIICETEDAFKITAEEFRATAGHKSGLRRTELPDWNFIYDSHHYTGSRHVSDLVSMAIEVSCSLKASLQRTELLSEPTDISCFSTKSPQRSLLSTTSDNMDDCTSALMM